VIAPNRVFGGGVGDKKDRLWNLLVDEFFSNFISSNEVSYCRDKQGAK
jgi:hypothetical protein